jgi:hypothetical protein
LAEEIRKPRIKADQVILPLGEAWTQQFIYRHPSLKTTTTESIERVRKEVTKEDIERFYEEFRKVIEEFDISEDNIYNFDEISI